MAESNREKTTFRFLGVSGCLPAVGGDTASYLLNDDTLIDAGWCAVLNMRPFGCDPIKINTVFVTHCHQDHYMGLAPLLFYFSMKRDDRPEGVPLKIVGPGSEINNAVQRAKHFLQWDRYQICHLPVEVAELQGGQQYEDDRFRVSAAYTLHCAFGLSYRIEDKLTGATIGLSGDTAYHPPLARHLAGVDVLVHEAAFGAVRADPLKPWGHSGAIDAAAIAAEAKCKRLYLVHYEADQREEILAAAREVFAETYAAAPGEVLQLPPD